MGADIHIHVEKLVDGSWQHIDYLEPYNDRDYVLFGLLAGVREPSFKTVGLGDPRGLPENASSATREEFESWGRDAHSTSHATVAELLAIEHDRPCVRKGLVSSREYLAWCDRGRQGQPQSWCGMVGGPNVEIVSNVGLDEKIASGIIPRAPLKDGSNLATDGKTYYTPLEWTVTAHETMRGTWFAFLAKLLTLGTADHIRIVFCFDN